MGTKQLGSFFLTFCFSDTSPLLNKSGSEHMFETMEMEIEQLLSKVKELQLSWVMKKGKKNLNEGKR